MTDDELLMLGRTPLQLGLATDDMLAEHMSMVKQDYSFPLSDEDSASFYLYWMRTLLTGGLELGHAGVVATIIVGATRHLSHTTVTR